MLCLMKNQDLIRSREFISTREPNWKTLVINKLQINFPNTKRSLKSWIVKLIWKTRKSKNSILTKDKSKWTKNSKKIKLTSSKNKTMIWINRCKKWKIVIQMFRVVSLHSSERIKKSLKKSWSKPREKSVKFETSTRWSTSQSIHQELTRKLTVI